jgi:hypothetical protein
MWSEAMPSLIDIAGGIGEVGAFAPGAMTV